MALDGAPVTSDNTLNMVIGQAVAILRTMGRETAERMLNAMVETAETEMRTYRHPISQTPEPTAGKHEFEQNEADLPAKLCVECGLWPDHHGHVGHGRCCCADCEPTPMQADNYVSMNSSWSMRQDRATPDPIYDLPGFDDTEDDEPLPPYQPGGMVHFAGHSVDYAIPDEAIVHPDDALSPQGRAVMEGLQRRLRRWEDDGGASEETDQG